MNAFQLKTLASMIMVLDHVGQFMPTAPLWFRYAGRIVAPIFFFLLVEGFIHTRSRCKYGLRLLAAGLIMTLGSTIITMSTAGNIPLVNNIFLSLALGIALMECLTRLKIPNPRFKDMFFATIIVFAMLMTEAHIYGVMMVLVFYYFKDMPRHLAILYSLIAILPSLFSSINIKQLLLIDYQWMMIFALPLLLTYNGELGPSSPAIKWSFYIFYPIHLWVIYIIATV